MRKTLALLTALCVGGAIGGCNNSNSDIKKVKVSPPTVETRLNPNWELKLQSKCPENVPHESCLGDFGFTVQTNGHYQIGPGPKNEIREGALAPEELDALNATLATSLAASNAEADNHQSIDAGESDDVVTLTRGPNNLAVLLKTQGKDLYYANSSVDEAKAIHNAVRKLAMKYYALPFPDACFDGANSLQSLYTSVQSCTADADCTYIDSSFNVVPANSQDWVITDDCSLLHPLAVANSSSVASNQSKLIDAFNELRTSCGDKFQRQECTQQAGFQPNNRAPICSQGLCQAPSTSFR